MKSKFYLSENPLPNILINSGNVKIFHGVNFVAKEAPWYHEGLLDPQYAKDLESWGLNVVRLGTMWSGLEPREGEYDMEYVDKLKQIISNFREHGIYVILDMHQDVASHYFKTYDGIPSWLVDKLRIGSERMFPWPLAGIDNWFCGYITYETGFVFQVCRVLSSSGYTWLLVAGILQQQVWSCGQAGQGVGCGGQGVQRCAQHPGLQHPQ